MSFRTCKFFTAFTCFGTLLVLYYCLLVTVIEKETLQVAKAHSIGSQTSENRARARDSRHSIVIDVERQTERSSEDASIISATPANSQDVHVVSKSTEALTQQLRSRHRQKSKILLPYNQTHITRQILVQESVRRTCQGINSSALSPWQLSYLLKHLIVDDRTRLLYCYVPKVGCANWKRVFNILYGAHHSVENISTVNHSSMKLLSSYSDHEISYRLKNYFKFMFVRHPLDRLLSAFRNKFEEHFKTFEAKYGVQIVRNFRPNPPAHPKGDDVTFAEFLAYVASTSNNLLNEHWSSYIDLCQPCFVDYDYVGHFEFLEEDASFLLATLKLDKFVHYPQKQKYYNILSEEEKGTYLQSVPSEVLRDVINKFALDFQLFGYHPHFIGAPH